MYSMFASLPYILGTYAPVDMDVDDIWSCPSDVFGDSWKFEVSTWTQWNQKTLKFSQDWYAHSYPLCTCVSTCIDMQWCDSLEVITWIYEQHEADTKLATKTNNILNFLMFPGASALSLCFILTVALFMFSCPLPCGSEFTTQKGLRRHQNNCKAFATVQALRLERRREKVKAVPKAAKRAYIEVCLAECL